MRALRIGVTTFALALAFSARASAEEAREGLEFRGVVSVGVGVCLTATCAGVSPDPHVSGLLSLTLGGAWFRHGVERIVVSLDLNARVGTWDRGGGGRLRVERSAIDLQSLALSYVFDLGAEARTLVLTPADGARPVLVPGLGLRVAKGSLSLLPYFQYGILFQPGFGPRALPEWSLSLGWSWWGAHR